MLNTLIKLLVDMRKNEIPLKTKEPECLQKNIAG